MHKAPLLQSATERRQRLSVFSFPTRRAGNEVPTRQHHELSRSFFIFLLVAKLLLGNALIEALASRFVVALLLNQHNVGKLELGYQ